MSLKRAGTASLIITIFFLSNLGLAYSSEQLRLKEIIPYEEGIEAIVVTPDGEELTVEEGDTLPYELGQVAEIKERSVAIKKPTSDGKATIIYQLSLPTKPGSLRVD